MTSRLAVTTLLSSLLLAGCGQNIDGTYDGESKMLGLIPVEFVLTIKGDKAELESMGQKPKPMKVQLTGDEFYLYEESPGDGVLMIIKDDGKTLECEDCRKRSLPSRWQRLGR